MLDLERPSDMTDYENLNNKNNNRWESCCFIIDRRVLIFTSQLLIGLIIISFCIYKLSVNDENPALYYGLLTFIIGVFLPSPKVNKS